MQKSRAMGKGCFFLFSWCFIVPFTADAQKSRDLRNEALLLKNALVTNHIQPRNIDDKFSRNTFDHFLNTIDPDKLYFTEDDLKPFEHYKTLLDDELNGKGWNFLKAIIPVYRNCIARAQVIIHQETKDAFKPSAKDFFVVDTARWASDEADLQLRWRRSLNFSTLDRLAEMKRLHNPVPANYFTAYEAEARQRVKAFEQRVLNRVLNHPSGFDNYVTMQYFTSMAAVFDPHSSYLDLTEMENLMASLSTEGYYFGVTMDENDKGDVIIAALTPGGPAWKSGELHAGDVLTDLRWDGQEHIDMAGVSLEEVNQLLSDANHSVIEMTVRKAAGILKTIKLQKEKISTEQSFVRSFVFSGRRKVGYISLPDFYTQWGDESEGSRCANDVAKEILKLKNENIEGLILDVRYNGGGSLEEAIALTGIFIDEGPLAVIKDRLQNTVSIKDVNRGTIYNGPLVVMVNGQSASASEILAAALQDYHRAVIAGSQTYGKATAQNFFPLDPHQKGELSLASVKEGLGFARITTDKIYRVTGKTAQGHGVKPDILLPDVFEAVDYHEAKVPYALTSDSIAKRTFYRPLPDLPLERLRRNSTSRVGSDSSFSMVTRTLSWLEMEISKEFDPVSLDWGGFSERADFNDVAYQSLEAALNRHTVSFDIQPTAMDRERIAADEFARDLNQKWIKRLKSDIYVDEVFHIINDLVELTQKPPK